MLSGALLAGLIGISLKFRYIGRILAQFRGKESRVEKIEGNVGKKRPFFTSSSRRVFLLATGGVFFLLATFFAAILLATGVKKIESFSQTKPKTRGSHRFFRKEKCARIEPSCSFGNIPLGVNLAESNKVFFLGEIRWVRPKCKCKKLHFFALAGPGAFFSHKPMENPEKNVKTAKKTRENAN